MTTLPILYSFRRCPYAIRARMAVAVSGVRVELREVVLRDKPAEMLEISPKATVPMLVLLDGRVIDESLDVMEWALTGSDVEGWLNHRDEELIAANDGPFKQALDRYKYPHRYGLADGGEGRTAAIGHLSGLDRRLIAQPFLAGNTRGFTDIALFPFVRQFAATDRAWFDAQSWDGLKRWLSDFERSQLFADVMERWPQRHGGDPPTYFPH